jgi:hypothetical protein
LWPSLFNLDTNSSEMKGISFHISIVWPSEMCGKRGSSLELSGIQRKSHAVGCKPFQRALPSRTAERRIKVFILTSVNN